MYVLGDLCADVVLGIGPVAGVSTRAGGSSEEEVRGGSHHRDTEAQRKRSNGNKAMKRSTMTANKLHQMLGELIKNGLGRVPVCVNKDTFSHPLEGDGAVILPVTDCRGERVPQIDDDGGTKITKSGREVSSLVIVLFGESDEGFVPEDATALAFLKRASDGKHRIVATGDLSPGQIDEARATGRLYVEPGGGLGWVLLPWDLTTPADMNRVSREQTLVKLGDAIVNEEL